MRAGESGAKASAALGSGADMSAPHRRTLSRRRVLAVLAASAAAARVPGAFAGTAVTRWRGFAFGAVRAAEWLDGRRGVFTLEDVLHDWLASRSTERASSA